MKLFVWRVIWSTSIKKLILYQMMSISEGKRGKLSWQLHLFLGTCQLPLAIVASTSTNDSIMILTITSEQNMYLDGCILWCSPKKISWFVIFKPGTVAYHLLLGKLSMCLNVMRKAPSALLVINRSITCNHYHSYSTS
jgi:hypothetical protein